MRFHDPRSRERREQSVQGGMQNRSPVQQLGRFTGGLIDNRIEGGGPRDQGAPHLGTFRIPSRALGQNVGKMARCFRNELRQQGRQPPRRK